MLHGKQVFIMRDETNEEFLGSVRLYLKSANGIPVSRVTLDADDLRRLLILAEQKEVGRVADSSIPVGVLLHKAMDA